MRLSTVPTGNRRGFTLVELAVTLAIIAILAAIAIGLTYKGTRNANVDTASNDLLIRMTGLPGTALTDGQDRLLVFVDRTSSGGVGRVFVLSSPPANWSIASFDPASPGMAYTVVELPTHTRLLNIAEAAAPAPYDASKLYDSRMVSTCGGTNCFAIRYGGDGEVRGEASGGGDSGASGFGFVLGDDLDTGSDGGSRRRAIVVGFPTGAVKAYQP